jgi:hypothetical protein
MLLQAGRDTMLNANRTEQVYEFIWCYVTQHEALASDQQITVVLGLPKEAVGGHIDSLRATGRIEDGTLLPMAYGAWWREHVRVRGKLSRNASITRI